MERNRGGRARGRSRFNGPNDRGRRSQSQRPAGTQPETNIFAMAQEQHQGQGARSSGERNRDRSVGSANNNKAGRHRSPNGRRPNDDVQRIQPEFRGGRGSRFNNRPARDEENGNRGGNFSRPAIGRKYPMGYRELEGLLTKPPSEVLFSTRSPKSGFKELLNSDSLNKEKLGMCLHAMARACGSDHTESLSEFLTMILNECQQFLNIRLVTYLIEVQNSPANMYQLNSMGYILNLIESFQYTVPQESLFATQLLVPQIEATIKRLHLTLGHGTELIQRVEKIEETKNKLMNRFTIIHGATRKEEAEVPNDFRDIPIFPDKHDLITNQRPFLRPNVVEGRYKSADHYLDVQFRLLREDFVRPLREGIAAYLEQIKNNKKRQRLQDIKVYQEVKLTKVILADDGVLHEVQFNTALLGNVRWERSKRLLYGALVCLTFDNFETVYFGTVGERKVEKLPQGIIAIKFEKQDEILSVQTETFTMVETEAYFEASRHILSALQTIDERHFPMKEYIVELQKQVEKPQYLTNDTVYCLRSMTESDSSLEEPQSPTKSRSVIDKLRSLLDLDHNEPQLERRYGQQANCSCMLESRRRPVSLFRNYTWPTPEELSLDSSQFDALKMALTQKIALIQGPPGTGKTHVGLKIMEVLFHNQSIWNTDIDNEEKNPILVVCFTNHALDQFLEGVLKLTNKIVRMGGRSESEPLKPFQMNNLKRVMGRTHKNENYMGRHFRDIKRELEIILTDIKRKERTLKTCGEDIMSEIDLKNEIGDVLYDSFYNHAPKFLKLSQRDTGKVLNYWLGRTIPAHLRSIPDENALVVEAYEEPYEVFENRPVDIDAESDSDGEIDVNVSDYEDAEDIPNEVMGRNLNQPPRPPAEGNNQNLEEFDPEYDYDPEDIEYIMAQRMEDDHGYRNARVLLLNKPDDDEKPQQDDGWQTQGGKKQQRKNLKTQLQRFTVLSEQELLHTRNIWSLKMDDRWRLYKTWLDRFVRNETKEIDDLKKDYEKKLATFAEIKTEEEVIVAKSALVIGMTTTGAAKYRHLVRNIRSKIVIVEEAAEVLEAQIVTSLSKYTEHLILIGDHQQLRPNPVVYELAKQYHLEISLFERLIKNGIPFARLGIQHRMKPTISRLLVPYIYDKLEDHSSVHKYEEILGFERSVFFLSHQQFELKDNDSTSRVNTHEAQFLVSLCRYILQQGYQPSQITILTTYLGQLFTLKRLMVGQLKEVRATVVDNYQGEENDIILLSFVRSNEQGIIGFLKTDNRVCVALSRAKKGLFCIGNFDSFAEKSPLWSNITQELTKYDAIGDALHLQCQNHDNIVPVKSSVDFIQVPDGGCTLPCDFRLLCGHVCDKKCHPLDKEHADYKCMKRCERVPRNCPLQHKCRKQCSEDCGPCTTIVLKILPKCGHVTNIQCHVDERMYQCRIPCPKRLPCGHKCTNICGDECLDCTVRVNVPGPCGHNVWIQCMDSNNEIKLKQECRERCPLILPCGHPCANDCGKPCGTICHANVQVPLPCGHNFRTTCDKSKNKKELQESCPVKCVANLECDHQCSGTCGTCYQGRLHALCGRKCQKILVCGHECQAPCSASCPPCMMRCQNRCPHSKCQQVCGFPCPPCQESCKWKCDHFECTAKCLEPCNRPPCNKYCHKKLKCGHTCVGMCGERCPRLCRICHKEDLQEIFFGHEDHPHARYIQLEDCKHVIEIRGLTKWVNDQSTTEGGEIKVLTCPHCKTPIRRNLRFSNEVKKALAKIEEVKAKVFGKIGENEALQNQLKYKVESFLETSRLGVVLRGSFSRSNGVFQNCAKPLLQELVFGKPVLDFQTLTSIENILTILEALNKVQIDFKENCLKIDEKTLHSFEDNVSIYSVTLAAMIDERLKQSVRGSTQFLADLRLETIRLQNMVNILKDFGKTRVHGTQAFKDLFDSVMAELLECKPITEIYVNELESKKKRLMELSGGAVIGISQSEKFEILKAMGLTQGHWYTCPNGHVYCITECGGAMEESRCNECNAPIGGGSHRLRSDNRVATAMDGARHSAWSQQVDIRNYEL